MGRWLMMLMLLMLTSVAGSAARPYAHIDGGPRKSSYFTDENASLRGDLDGNRILDINDVTLLIDVVLGKDVEYDANAADCNTAQGDGSVDINDVTSLIARVLSGDWPGEEPQPATETFTVNGVTFTMVLVEGGNFMMGASDNDEDAYYNEKPAHEVTLSSYSIGETEVTQALWLAVMGSNPSRFTGDLTRPVECVSWNDCQAFIIQLNQLTGKSFRLPTEAEWEFAARGGNESQGCLYSGSDDISEVAWYRGNSSSKTHPVATKAPNELGLYDMSGNVFEWCSDWYGSYTDTDVQTNPQGPSSGSTRMSRSGSWDTTADYCRVSFRLSRSPASLNHSLGLRLALDQDNSAKFRLSDAVVILLVGDSVTVEILNGSGHYMTSGAESVASCAIDGNSLTVTGVAAGTKTVCITDTSTGATILLNVIVRNV